MAFEALNNAVLFELIGGKVTKRGDLVIPDEIARDSRWARVTSRGPGVPDLNGTLIEPGVEVDDVIYIMLHGKIEIDISPVKEGEKIYAVGALDIMGKLDANGEFAPIGNFLLIEKVELPKETDSGLIIPDTQVPPSGIARVLKLGTGWVNAYGDPIPFHVKEGDLVVYNPLSAMVVDWKPMGKDTEQYLVSHGDLIAKYIPEEQ